LNAVGGAKSLTNKKFKFDAEQRFAAVIDFLRQALQLTPQQQLVRSFSVP